MLGKNILTCPFEIQYCGWMQDIYPWLQERLHTPFWRLYWNLKPGGILRSAAEEMHLTCGNFVLIPANFEFSTEADVSFDQFYIHFNFVDTVKVLGDRFYTIPGDRFSEEYIEEFVASFRKLDNRLRCEMIAHVILGHALLKCQDGPRIQELPSEQRILDCIQFISEHLSQKLDNTRLAARCSLTRNTFVRLFSETMEESPQNFIRRKRIERACYLLHFSDLSIKEIALQTGFANQYHFSTVFARLQQNSPQKFRNSHLSFQNHFSLDKWLQT